MAESILIGAIPPLPFARPCLPRSFFARDALVVARAMIGCAVVHERAGGGTAVARIVETEAYRGPKDLACHARAGLTKRTRTLLGPEGHAYVYFVYGMHDCFNVTCLGAGMGHAVLVRAAEAISGFEPGARLDGPGRFARAMGITRALDGHDVTGSRTLEESGPERERGSRTLEESGPERERGSLLLLLPRSGRVRIGVSPRVGVAYSGPWADKPWRFFDALSDQVSRPPRSAIGRGPLVAET
jgi:DNA-3-methyladenine glycosylase